MKISGQAPLGFSVVLAHHGEFEEANDRGVQKVQGFLAGDRDVHDKALGTHALKQAASLSLGNTGARGNGCDARGEEWHRGRQVTLFRGEENLEDLEERRVCRCSDGHAIQSLLELQEIRLESVVSHADVHNMGASHAYRVFVTVRAK